MCISYTKAFRACSEISTFFLPRQMFFFPYIFFFPVCSKNQIVAIGTDYRRDGRRKPGGECNMFNLLRRSQTGGWDSAVDLRLWPRLSRTMVSTLITTAEQSKILSCFSANWFWGNTSLQQWFEYCPSTNKRNCPICKQKCHLRDPFRLYFQSSGNQIDSVASQKVEEDPVLLRGEVKRLEGKIQNLTSVLEGQQKQNLEVSDQVLC